MAITNRHRNATSTRARLAILGPSVKVSDLLSLVSPSTPSLCRLYTLVEISRGRPRTSVYLLHSLSLASPPISHVSVFWESKDFNFSRSNVYMMCSCWEVVARNSWQEVLFEFVKPILLDT